MAAAASGAGAGSPVVGGHPVGGHPVGTATIGTAIGCARGGRNCCQAAGATALRKDQRVTNRLAQELISKIYDSFPKHESRANKSLGLDPFLAGFHFKLEHCFEGPLLAPPSELAGKFSPPTGPVEGCTRKVVDFAVPFFSFGGILCALQCAIGMTSERSINRLPEFVAAILYDIENIPLSSSILAGFAGVAGGCCADLLDPLTKENLVPRLIEALLISCKSLFPRDILPHLETIRDEGVLKEGTELDVLVAITAAVLNKAARGSELPSLPYGMEGFPEESRPETIYDALRNKAMKQLLYAFLGEISKDKEPTQLLYILLRLLSEEKFPSIMWRSADSLVKCHIRGLPSPFRILSKEAWPPEFQEFFPGLDDKYLREHSLEKLKEACVANYPKIFAKLSETCAPEFREINTQMGELKLSESLFSDTNKGVMKEIAHQMDVMRTKGFSEFEELSLILGKKRPAVCPRLTPVLREKFKTEMTVKVNALSLEKDPLEVDFEISKETQESYEAICSSIKETLTQLDVLKEMEIDVAELYNTLSQKLEDLESSYRSEQKASRRAAPTGLDVTLPIAFAAATLDAVGRRGKRK